jgi:hypothetical protein
MANKIVSDRLGSILSLLRQAHSGGTGMPSACVGSERESFINLALSNVISPPFRVGTGAITDVTGYITGQLDIVIEYGISISLPLLSGDAPRLYLAEPVCAVIEIKSNLENQWGDVLASAEKVRTIRRADCVMSDIDGGMPSKIPFFAVGYTGWKGSETVAEKISGAGGLVDGVLVIDSAIYVGRHPDYSDHCLEGPTSLFGLFLSLEQLMSNMVWMKPPYKAYVAN